MGTTEQALALDRRRSAHTAKPAPQTIAWGMGSCVIVMLAASLVLNFAFGTLTPVETAYGTSIASAVVGALIASRHPENPLGWMLLVITLATAISTVPFEYGYTALFVHPGSLPFGAFALWLASWMWIPSFGFGLAAPILRFPDGRVPHGWGFVDRLAIAGTVFFIVAVAFAPGPLFPTHRIDNPLGIAGARGVLSLLFSVGVAMIAAAMLAAVASLAARYHHADRQVRQQVKWILLGTGVVALALAYSAGVVILFHPDLSTALVPFTLSLVVVPVSVGIAMLKHHLFDIDLIISRTLHYAILTAILGGIYVAGTELGQRLVVAYTGQRSDVAIVFSVFVVAAAFTPAQKWAEGFVDRRVGVRDPAEQLDKLASSIEAVTRVIDPHQVARHVLDQAVSLFEAAGGALYLDSFDHARPYHTNGHVGGECAVEVAVRHGERNLGRLLLGVRRGGSHYSDHDRLTIQRSADVLGQALAVAHDFGHVAHQPADGTGSSS